MKSFFDSIKKSNFSETVKNSMFVRSAKELTSLRCLCVTAMLIALDIVLKLLLSIQITPTIKISFAFIALSAIGMLYGPTVGFIAGMITDLLGFVVKPTGEFNFWFTLIEALGGLLYGLFLYNSVNGKWMLPRIIAAKATVVVVCNLFLTTWAISFFYGNGFMALLPARVISNLAQMPFDILLLAIFLPGILRAYNGVFKGARTVSQKTFFSDQGVITAMLYLVSMLFLLVCCLGIASQDVRTKNTELKKTVSEQSDRIDAMQAELDALYEAVGVEKQIVQPE